MRRRGSDQGGRWPVGIWFALVGMSAGTVTSFALIGWTFTRGLYTGDGTAEPLEFEPGTVIIEAEEPLDETGADAEETGLDGLVEPGSVFEVDPSPAEPRAEPVPEAGGEDASEAPEAPEAPLQPEPPVEHGEVEDPALVPVEDGESGCPPGEESDAPDWDYDWHRHDGEDPWLRPEFETRGFAATEPPALD